MSGGGDLITQIQLEGTTSHAVDVDSLLVVPDGSAE
jgi:hypothetical protein